MNRQTIGNSLLIVMGAISAFLAFWVYLLQPELNFLMFGLVGVLIVVAGVVRMARARKRI